MSDSAPNFFGYKASEFQQVSTVNEIMPRIIAAQHDKIIERLLVSGREKIIRKYRVAFGNSKD